MDLNERVEVFLLRAQDQQGFTLIELMIAVAIVGILTAIAYPSYTEYVNKSRRTDGMAALLSAQLEQEKFRANNVSYASTLASAGVAANSPDGYYTIGVASSGSNTFTMTAAPAGVQSGDRCGTFAVDENGPDTSGGYADADCWQR
ncbi:type IV pilin protein [Amphritea sp. HPY]|uniref:type IV pilin protein n=1 Tax=Amphritea sp. HPY TaxID=3421652 RepID=UPI003D7EBD2F